jgi:hypothetical protein
VVDDRLDQPAAESLAAMPLSHYDVVDHRVVDVIGKHSRGSDDHSSIGLAQRD